MTTTTLATIRRYPSPGGAGETKPAPAAAPVSFDRQYSAGRGGLVLVGPEHFDADHFVPKLEPL